MRSNLLHHLGRFLIVGVVMTAGLQHIERLIQDDIASTQQALRGEIFTQAAELRAELEHGVSSTVFLAQGLVAFIRAVAAPTDEQVQTALATIYQQDPSIRNIGLAPANVLRYVYPMKGNEAAIGLVYADHPKQWPSVERAIQQKSSLLVGPVQLVQGGRAIINRTPIFLDNEDYWGIISIVIDIDKLLQTVGVSETTKTMRISLGPGEQAPANSAYFIGHAGSVNSASAIRMSVTIPGGHWDLLAEPVTGWPSFQELSQRKRVYYRLGLLGFLILLWIVLTSWKRAREMAGKLSDLNDELTTSNEALEYLSRFDSLTNLANRRYFDEVSQRELASCQRHQLNFSVLMIDLDHFKNINDEHGHVVGDLCLVRVAELILSSLQRAGDFAARYGGEEFIVIAPGANPQQAIALAEKIRRAIAGTLIEPPGLAEPFRLTASVGCATTSPAFPSNIDDLCNRADQALYQAKRAGRNRVIHIDAEAEAERLTPA